MAVTLTMDPQGELNYTINQRAARQFQLVAGSFDYGATAGGGVSMDIPINNVKGCMVMPAYGYTFLYSAGTLKAYYVGSIDITSSAGLAEAFTQVATGTAMATCSALNFFAWGYK